MNFQPFGPQQAEELLQMQKMWSNTWAQALQSFQGAVPSGGVPFPSATPVKMPELPQLQLSPQRLQDIQKSYIEEATRLWNEGLRSSSFQKDKRFKSEAWQDPMAAFSAALYTLNAKTLMGMAEAVEGDEKTKARIRFSIEQWLAATAPSNFLALNPEAQRKALETKGESLAKGVQNLLHDLRQGHVSMTDESQFEVGRNVATTEGAIVYENEFFQLIEYKPLTGKVFERPFLLVPPCINKYYILDLQPGNSLIRYAISEGHRTFVVSWRNPDQSMAQATWDDYIEKAVIEAITQVQQFTKAKQINALGFCVGGTMLATALSVLHARGQEPVASATLLTTLVDFADTGILDLFIDENFVQWRELQMGKGGLMKGQDLATTFSFLRPNDLVWNYVVGNYLKGETPPPFDLLYWNSDSTNLPGPYYAWYLRNLYLENRLVQPGALTVCGEKVDLQALQTPMYIYGSREDHIVPIQAAYASTQVFQGPTRFVMGASGHIAGVINPPGSGKRSHWIGEEGVFPATLDEWLTTATEYPGSWWTDWSQWLKSHAGKQIAAPKGYGKGASFSTIEPAPGRYVQQKA